MKRYAILLILSLGLCLGLGAQNPPAKGTPTEKDQGRELRENLRKATEAFMAAPDSKEAENNFVEAQKAVFAYQKKLEAQRKARAKRKTAARPTFRQKPDSKRPTTGSKRRRKPLSSRCHPLRRAMLS